jgi:hypothetical protein
VPVLFLDVLVRCCLVWYVVMQSVGTLETFSILLFGALRLANPIPICRSVAAAALVVPAAVVTLCSLELARTRCPARYVAPRYQRFIRSSGSIVTRTYTYNDIDTEMSIIKSFSTTTTTIVLLMTSLLH